MWVPHNFHFVFFMTHVIVCSCVGRKSLVDTLYMSIPLSFPLFLLRDNSVVMAVEAGGGRRQV
jgi:hypothetical protein